MHCKTSNCNARGGRLKREHGDQRLAALISCVCGSLPPSEVVAPCERLWVREVGLGISGRFEEPSRHETSDRLSPHRAGRPAVASVESDAHSERGFSGTDGERELERAAVAVAAGEREYAAQAYPAGGILLRARRCG